MQFELLPPVPAVVLARQLRQIPLFSFAMIDELFRFSGIARQVRHTAGSTFQKEGNPAEHIQVLVEGKAVLSAMGREDEEVSSPTILGFREVLEGAPLRTTARATTTAICLAMEAEDFRSLMSDNIELAEGLFRMLLEEKGSRGVPSIERRAVDVTGRLTPMDTASRLRPIDKALLLQGLSIFSRATAEELLALGAIVRPSDLKKGTDLFAQGDYPSIWVVLTGSIRIDTAAAEATESLVASAGDALGIYETLAGKPWSWHGRAHEDGVALRIERDDLFGLLSDQTGLLQGLFSALFRFDHPAAKGKM